MSIIAVVLLVLLSIDLLIAAVSLVVLRRVEPNVTASLVILVLALWYFGGLTW